MFVRSSVMHTAQILVPVSSCLVQDVLQCFCIVFDNFSVDLVIHIIYLSDHTHSYAWFFLTASFTTSSSLGVWSLSTTCPPFKNKHVGKCLI